VRLNIDRPRNEMSQKGKTNPTEGEKAGLRSSGAWGPGGKQGGSVPIK